MASFIVFVSFGHFNLAKIGHYHVALTPNSRIALQINVIILSVIFVPPFLVFDTFMEAQDDYFVNLFTPLYKILSAPFWDD